MAIKKINDEKISAIKAKSVKALPNRPSEKGYTAEQLKTYFTNIVLDEKDSAISEINRIVDEVSNTIGDIGDASIKDFVITYIVGKLTEEAPILSLDFEDGKLKYTKYGTSEIKEIDISPKSISLDIVSGEIDNKEFKAYIKEAHSNSEEALQKLSELVEGADNTLDTIGEISKALKDNANIIDTLVVKEAGKGLSTNDFTDEDKEKLDNTPSEFADVATSGSYNDLNDKPELFDGDYNSLINKPTIPSIEGLASEDYVKDYAQPKGDYITEINREDVNNALGYVPASYSNFQELSFKIQGREQAKTFKNTQEIQSWIDGAIVGDGFPVSRAFIGLNLYTTDNEDNDYWVSSIPVTSMSNLSILPTDKIDLDEYVKTVELARVAETGDYTDLKNTPDIPTNLSELNDDENHRLVTDTILNTISENTSDIQSLEETKLNIELGADEANKMLVTDANGNITTVMAGSSFRLVDNLESTATDLGLTANQGRVLDGKKLNKQQGASNKNKLLYVNDEGLVDLQPIKTKVSEFENDSNFATEEFVNTNGGKIDAIKVNGVTQEIVNKEVDIEVPSIEGLASETYVNQETAKKVDKVEGKGLSTNDYTTAEKNKLAGLSNYDDSVITEDITNLENNKVDKVTGKALSTNDFTNAYKTKLDGLSNYDDTKVKSDISSLSTNKADKSSVTAIDGRVTTIEGKIPTLASQDFVNSSIATATATFKGTYDEFADLKSVSADENDYAFVENTDSAGNKLYKRYKYVDGAWVFEYDLNNSSFTANQWATINSGVTASDRQSFVDNITEVGNIKTTLTTKADKSEIPSVNDATILVRVNGAAVGSFTTNQSTDEEIDISVPTGTAASKGYTTSITGSSNLPTDAAVKSFVEGKGYITKDASITGNAATATKATGDGNGNNIVNTYATKSALSDVDAKIPTTAVSYASQSLTTAQKTQARTNIGAGTSSFSGSYNDLTNKPTIPTNNNQLTNGAGYVTSSGSVASATKATQDGSGNVITSTYLPKTGGAISPTTGDTPLILNSATTNGAYLGLKRKDATYSTYIGINANDNPIIQTGGTSKQIATLDDIPSVPDIDGGLLEFMNDEYNKTLNKAQFIDGTYTLSVPSSNTSVTLSNAFNLTTLEAGTYYLSFTMTGGANAWGFNAIKFWNGSTNVFSKTFTSNQVVSINTTKVFSYAFTLTEKITFNKISFTKALGSSNTSYISQVMINSGTSALPYKKYGGGDIAHLGDIHPIGTYLWTDGSYTPAERFGGTWEKIKDVFLLASGSSYSVGSKGGEATHTLTIDEIPAHTHDGTNKYLTDSNVTTAWRVGLRVAKESAAVNSWESQSTTGGGQAHNNMPPYLVGDLWHRIA